MRTIRRPGRSLSAFALGLSAFGLTLAVPMASASAAEQTAQNLTLTSEIAVRQSVMPLSTASNAAVEVTTELDCNTHTIRAMVKNVTTAEITPTVTFNAMPSAYDIEPTIKPGKTAWYPYAFSGNYVPIDIAVKVDGKPDVTLSPTAICSEPISFLAGETSQSAVTGYLQNNSTLLPQTVLLRIGAGDVRTEVLAPGESRLVALPFIGYDEQRYAYLTIAVTGGFESSYSIDLKQPLLEPVD